MTRRWGLAALQAFVSAMGKRYENGRNYDHGAGDNSAVSVLSSHIRRRLLTETEIVGAALAAQGPDDAHVFIDEGIWRGYFKGWLEWRPQVWDSYVAGLNADIVALKRDLQMRRDVELAETAQTGMAYFDTWAQELVEIGYLHNHARMWFASIWIFTLGLPWRLGADFFYRHLLDGDAAANTLSWRWAAGLHTRGKPYPARAQNIATFSGGRFKPLDLDLARVTKGLEATEPDELPIVLPLCDMHAPNTDAPTALLITDEDRKIEDFNLSGLDICATAILSCAHLRSPCAVAEMVATAERSALADAATRLGVRPTQIEASDPQDLADCAVASGARQILTPYATRGPLRDWLTRAEPPLAGRGITLCEQRRVWDEVIWPHATTGFFKVRKKIPRILEETGLL